MLSDSKTKVEVLKMKIMRLNMMSSTHKDEEGENERVKSCQRRRQLRHLKGECPCCGIESMWKPDSCREPGASLKPILRLKAHNR